ncbi:MAG TPA: sensor histidine kinase [Chthoniobacteraceae bacterium]|jgi:signal transduction histidine kinase|nr:sensor histidine kinase [Chthoniobacteraceae bacterium]
MRLAQFIPANMEAILSEWEAFARTLYPNSSRLTPLQLRDHAEQILEAVVKDLESAQSKEEQCAKSWGRSPVPMDAPETAAQTHAVLRAQSGMDITQLAAEYRALRASVLRLWEAACAPGADGLQEVIRFNEAIDQAVAESIGFFTARVERARNLLLGTLGHDMRNPLTAIIMTATSLARMNAGEGVSHAAECLIRSGSSIKALLDDLVDYGRVKLGVGIRIEVSDCDLGVLLADELKQHRAAHPGREVEMTVEGDLKGRWDGRRLQQALRNLVSNAIAYGSDGEPVRVAARGDETGVRIEVMNKGTAIEAFQAERLFDPLRRGETGHRRSNRDGLGLGLYIVREITRAHAGEVDLRSDATETVFSVRLPRSSAPATVVS